jgi:hypothetical protein
LRLLAGKREFVAEKAKAVGEQKERLLRIRNEKAEQAKEEDQLLVLLKAQLDAQDAEVLKQKEEMEKLDQHIHGLRGQRQGVKVA